MSEKESFTYMYAPTCEQNISGKITLKPRNNDCLQGGGLENCPMGGRETLLGMF